MAEIFKKLVKKRRKSGFTILELMITIFVIAVALVGGMTALQKTTALTSASSDRLIAAYLVQEGLEIVRNIRDGNWLDGDPSWNYGFDNCGTGCIVDYNRYLDDRGPSQISFSDQRLNVDSSIGYQYGGGNETKFKRKVIITPDPNDSNILNISVEVIWSDKGASNSFSAQENLYNWR